MISTVRRTKLCKSLGTTANEVTEERRSNRWDS